MRLPLFSAEALTDARDIALSELLRLLAERGYDFVTPTPETHRRVVARPERRQARTLEDILGWSLPFEAGLLDPDVQALLRRADMLEEAPGALLRSRIRVSRLRDILYLHSAYPTLAEDAVFFGPDSYRFADLIAAELARDPLLPGRHFVDIGAGSGVGAIVAARFCPGARLTMTDINPGALRFARINAAAAGVNAALVETAGLDGVEGPIDIAAINPPYIIDAGGPTYRHGGDMHGGRLSLDLAREATSRLAPGGRVILYTGSAIVGGGDALRQALAEMVGHGGAGLRYREIDPDIFGEELDRPTYRDVDRIALIAAIITKAA